VLITIFVIYLHYIPIFYIIKAIGFTKNRTTKIGLQNENAFMDVTTNVNQHYSQLTKYDL